LLTDRSIAGVCTDEPKDYASDSRYDESNAEGRCAHTYPSSRPAVTCGHITFARAGRILNDERRAILLVRGGPVVPGALVLLAACCGQRNVMTETCRFRGTQTTVAVVVTLAGRGDIDRFAAVAAWQIAAAITLSEGMGRN
jgi:hypothetical protein